MFRLFAFVILFLSATIVLPLTDVAPSRSSGDCQLNGNAYANVAPPLEDCDGKKAGDECKTRFERKKGKCVKICIEDDRAKCNEPNPLTTLECQAPADPKANLAPPPK